MEVQALFRSVFVRWGLPQGMRVDNGHPWGTANDLPTALALWLIGLGITMNWNPPRHPWLNPKVERCNGVTQQWAEPQACADLPALQKRLEWAGRTQRQEYPSIQGLPRLDAYPQLLDPWRPYGIGDECRMWDLRRVDAFLAKGTWYRRADRYGSISVYNRNKSLGKTYHGQEVLLRFDARNRHWVVWDSQGEVIARFLAKELSQERIMKLEVGHRKPSRQKSKGV